MRCQPLAERKRAATNTSYLKEDLGRQMRRHNSRGVFGAHHKTEKRTKTHRRRRADEVQSGYRRLEDGAQPWRRLEALDCAPQIRSEQVEAVDTNHVTTAGDHMIDDELTLGSILCRTQLERYAVGFLARLHD